MLTTLDFVIFHHKFFDRLAVAKSQHYMIEDYPLEKIEREEAIDAAKYLFREFLENAIKEKFALPFSEQEFNLYIKQAYEKSDFDWKDKTKFFEFGNLYDKLIVRNF